VDGAQQGFAVVLVESGPALCLGAGSAAQALDDAGQRLLMALERACIDGVELQTSLTPVFTQTHGLFLAAWAELVVIIRAKRGLAMAHKVEVSHGADVGPWPLAALSCLRPGGAWVTADWFAFPHPASGLRCGHGLALG
jgi:hypothetical protein